MSTLIDKILEGLGNLFSRNYKKPSFWFFIVVIFLTALVLFPYIDSNIFYYSRIDKRVDILERIIALDLDKVKNDPILLNEYNSILSEIDNQRDYSVNYIFSNIGSIFQSAISYKDADGIKIIKFISGAFWCLLITICIPFMNTFKGKSDKLIALIIMIVVSLVVGSICSAIPVIISPIVNYTGIPLLQLVIAIIVATRKKK